MDTLRIDLRHAARALARNPVSTFVAVLSLALAIGANSALFSLVSAALLRPLPVADPAALVRIGAAQPGADFTTLSFPELEAVQGAHTLAGALGHQMHGALIDFGDAPTEDMVEVVTESYFDVLGVAPALGRTFADAARDGPGVVLSDRVWRDRLGRRNDVVGTPVRINGRPFTVLGVMPAGFAGTFPGMRISAWVPLRDAAGVLDAGIDLTSNRDRVLMAMGRLAPGVAREKARDELASLVAGADGGAFPERGVALRSASGVHPLLKGLVAGFLAALMGVSGLVLLIACANVANLLLARGAARAGELAVRVSVGASRWRIVRQLLAESALIGLLASVGGLLIAVWTSGLLTHLTPPSTVPLGLDVGIDRGVLLFTLVLGLASTLVSGMVPAFRVSSVDPARILRREAGRGARGRGAAALVAAQVAVSAVLLVGSGLLVRGLAASGRVDPGFDARGVTVLSASPELRFGDDRAKTNAYWDELEGRAAALPEVRSVGVALYVPLGDRSDRMRMSADGDGGEGGRQRPFVGYNVTRPGYFGALGIPLLEGRDFTASDRADAPPVVVVNEALARSAFGGEALGRTLHIEERTGVVRDATVVGVVATTQVRALGEAPTPFAYLPHPQLDRPDMVLFVRSDGGTSLAPLLRDAARAVEPDVAVRVRPITDDMAFSLTPARIMGWVLGVAGALGLFLAGTGVFGVVSHATARRLPEMGVRMALGADPGRVRALVLGGALRTTLGGLVAGLAAAALLSGALGRFLYGLSPWDPATFGATAAVLVGATLLAAFFPARSAGRLDPATILRRE